MSEPQESRGANEEYNVTSLTSLDEVQNMRPVWEILQDHPNSDFSHYVNVVHSKSAVVRPHVLVLSQGNLPRLLVVGRIERIPIPLRVGYRTVATPELTALTVVYKGLLGDASEAACRVVLEELIGVLASREVAVVRLNNIDTSSTLHRLVTTVPGFLSRDHLSSPNRHWRMSLPETLDSFFASRSRKHRYWLRRMERLLVEDHPGGTHFAVYPKDIDLPQLFTSAESISSGTYQRGLGVGFRDRAESRQILTALADRDQLRGYLLYVGDEARAFWIGQRYRDTFYVYYTGYDEGLRKYEPGTVLFVKMIEDLSSIKTLRFLDFGFGDASYKSRFGDENWFESTVHIFARTPRALTVNVARALTEGGHRVAVKCLRRLNLLDKVKRGWRRRVANGGR